MGSIISPTHAPLPWPSLTTFTATTTLMEKVSRVTNGVVFVGATCGIYALAVLSVTPLAIAAYVCMALVARKVISVAIGYISYPEACDSLWPSYRKSLQDTENKQIKNLIENNFLVQKIKLYKSGVEYDGILVSHPDIDQKKWTIRALGNCMAMERYIESIATENFSNGSCTLLVNPSSVGSSGGWPTRYQLGAGLEAGMQLLEKHFTATHILLDGFSIGWGILSEAILTHDFSEAKKQGTHYLAVSRVPFSTLANIAAKVSAIAKFLCHLCGMDLDGIEASKKLTREGIPQIIIQHTSPHADDSDGVIPDDVSLAYALRLRGIHTDKILLESPSIEHNDALPAKFKARLKDDIQEFFST